MRLHLTLSCSAGEGGDPAKAGEPGEGLSVAKRFQDRLDDTTSVGKHVVVPEANHAPTLSFEKSRATLVRGVSGVLAAIDFDDEVMLRAGEIDDEAADRMLAAKPVSGQPTIAQCRP
jgi:hypothetical protein